MLGTCDALLMIDSANFNLDKYVKDNPKFNNYHRKVHGHNIFEHIINGQAPG